MKLEEWAALDQSHREKIEAECYARGTPREIGVLADEAANLLSTVLETAPGVTAIGTGEDNVAKRSVIIVTTSVSETDVLDTIPSEFYGFPVVQRGIREKKKRFLLRLEFVLRAAKLSEHEISDCLTNCSTKLNDSGSVYYAETPGRWIAIMLIYAQFGEEFVGSPRVSLRGELAMTINGFFQQTDPAVIGMDIQEMSRMAVLLENVLSKYRINQ